MPGVLGGKEMSARRRILVRAKGLVFLSFIVFFSLLIYNTSLYLTPNADADCDCNFCHGDPHGPGWLGCGACHGFPPATASHQKHFQSGQLYQKYGDTSITKDFDSFSTAYIMSCGNCHPLDNAKHRNGSVEVELYNANAPAGSLKAKNLPSASYAPGGTVYYDDKGLPYTLGTCSGVYCHSYNSWTSNGPTADQGCDAFIPPNLVTTRNYRQPVWGATLTCSGCHGNPPLTQYPANDGGIGDSHQWIDDWGYGNLHAFNHGFDPVRCSYCHNDTTVWQTPCSDPAYTSEGSCTTNGGTWFYTRDSITDVTTMNNVPIQNYSKHVNGTVDVAFDKVTSFPYRTPYSLASASYDPSTKTCSNVSCHQNQTSVPWGASYKYYSWMTGECNRCHHIGYCP
jgi:predicted CxxxxCH...CXXCH cytochrome family protein